MPAVIVGADPMFTSIGFAYSGGVVVGCDPAEFQQGQGSGGAHIEVSGIAPGEVIIDTPGTLTTAELADPPYSVPAGVDLRIECWGPGGAGGSAFSTGVAGGGGGGGGYAAATVGGALWASGGSVRVGINGGLSSLVTLDGVARIEAGVGGDGFELGGAGGIGTTGAGVIDPVTDPGVNGVDRAGTTGGAGGAAGGGGGAGGAAGAGAGLDGDPGVAPGGGGGGSGEGPAGGGSGTDGRVRIVWPPP